MYQDKPQERNPDSNIKKSLYSLTSARGCSLLAGVGAYPGIMPGRMPVRLGFIVYDEMPFPANESR